MKVVQQGVVNMIKERKAHKSSPKNPKNKKQHQQTSTDVEPSTANTTTCPKQISSLNLNEMKPSVPLILEFKQHKIVENRIRSKEQIEKTWKLGKFIGHGSTATVYKAFNNYTGQLVAVKKIIFSNQHALSCKKQLKVLCKISHQNVVRYIEYQQIDNETWIFMEYIPNTLDKFIQEFGVPPIETFYKFAKQIIKAIQYLHRDKIIHKDIKCSNILLNDDGIIKISDFGTSKEFNQTVSIKRYELQGCQTFKGSVLWMAPQSIKSNKFSRKSDMWSLGCSLLQMATGKCPWYQKNFENDIAALFCIGMSDQLPHVPENLDNNIKSLIGSCLKRNPQERLTAQQLLKKDFFN